MLISLHDVEDQAVSFSVCPYEYQHHMAPKLVALFKFPPNLFNYR